MKRLEDFSAEQAEKMQYVLDPNRMSAHDKLLNRCKERCLYLLEHSEKTEARLRDKLRVSGKYTEDIIEEAMDFLKHYGYLDDRRFAERLLRSYAGQKSMREIEQKLHQRGVASADIRAVLEDFREDTARSEEAEFQAVQKAIRKKYRPGAAFGPEEKRKLYAALLRKGFSYELVARALALEVEGV